MKVITSKKYRKKNTISRYSDEMATEYKTLRDEILQLYREQTQLAFVSSLPLLGSLVLKDVSVLAAKWIILSAALILLGAISWKIRSNYYKIFCLGTYLGVIHERRGKEPTRFHPGPFRPGWHTRWRKIDAAPSLHLDLKGKLGRATAQADAIFLGAIAIAQIILTIGNDLSYAAIRIADLSFASGALPQLLTEIKPTKFLTIFIVVVAVFFLLRNLSELWNIQKYVGKYREELEAMVRERRC